MDIQEQEVVRPVFDPSDPNNLFASLEEITAPVERIKQTDHSEAQSNPLPQEEETLPIPPVENAPTMADSPEAPAPVEEETLPPENDAPATAEEVADAASQMDIIPEETISENETIADVSQTESDFSVAVWPKARAQYR